MVFANYEQPHFIDNKLHVSQIQFKGRDEFTNHPQVQTNTLKMEARRSTIALDKTGLLWKSRERKRGSGGLHQKKIFRITPSTT